ncbi:S16 family serine protease [Roseibacillus persicicus]|uniref:Lon proteolytic domain-containing protein n=1 Tax=Roseibacillus persicicus TaxID=454148 RepID=A0A918TE59_9BACT|nr:S16 family serine protease [Roseibacillus persicicus]MDQ8190081.1 hypothetical protein [Roseibacillus persicicus]GHC41794.1 hypothetical protein GCM10007100_03310 [Roseibacillus persicicus]
MKGSVQLLVCLLTGSLFQVAVAEEPALRQAMIKGLLVVELGDGSHAGTASQMNGTVVKGSGTGFEVSFNQEVGEMMESATSEVAKFMSVRHGDDLPEGVKVELAFADKYSPKDGPSAAVVSALLCESIISGDVIDSGFAATGDMTATGEVRSIGGLTGKISGAIKKGCELLAAPEANKSSFQDLLLIDGIKPLYEIQLFTISDFEQARAIAMEERDEDMQTAIDEFELVQGALKKDEAFLKNQKVREKLRNIVQLAPNHVSARLLYLESVGKAPSQLSLPGSLTKIEQAAGSLSAMLQDGSFLESKGNDNVLFRLANDIANMRPMLDPRTLDYSDSYSDVANYVKQLRGRSQISRGQVEKFNQMVETVVAERENLLNDQEIREELMLE